MLGWYAILASIPAVILWHFVTAEPPPPLTPEQLVATERASREMAERMIAEKEERDAERKEHHRKCEYLWDHSWWDNAGVREISSGDVIVNPELWNELWFDDKERYLKQIVDCDHGLWLDVIDGKTGKEIASWSPIFGLDVD